MVIKNAISAVMQEIVLQNSFPETDSKVKYRWQVILEAAKAAKDFFQPTRDIHDHAKKDGNFCDTLGRLVSASRHGDLLLRSSSKRSQSQLLVSKGYHMRVRHVLVNPSCHVSKWMKSGNRPKERWFTREIGQERLQVGNLVFGREDQA